jgi:predicted  nucleic acid-binding Zn-ribbon protein
MSDGIGDLQRLEQEEGAVSQRRRRLHERIDFLRQSGLAAAGDQERLAALEAEEREVSRQRKGLHERIDAIRAQVAAGRAGARGASPRERLLDRPSAEYVASLHPVADPLPPRPA